MNKRQEIVLKYKKSGVRVGTCCSVWHLRWKNKILRYALMDI